MYVYITCMYIYIYGGKTRNKTNFMSQVSGYKGPGRFLGDRDPGERSQTTWNARGEKHLSYGWKMVI